MLGMVYVAFKQTNEMQDEKYYEKELVYQGLIDGKNNLNPYLSELVCADSVDFFYIAIPKKISTNTTEAKVQFVRASDQSKDVEYPLTPDSNGVQRISKKDFIRGEYVSKLSWKQNNTPYFFEKKVFIEKP